MLQHTAVQLPGRAAQQVAPLRARPPAPPRPRKLRAPPEPSAPIDAPIRHPPPPAAAQAHSLRAAPRRAGAPTPARRGSLRVHARRWDADQLADRDVISLARGRLGKAPPPTDNPVADFVSKVQAAWQIFFPPRPKSLTPKSEAKKRLRMILVADRLVAAASSDARAARPTKRGAGLVALRRARPALQSTRPLPRPGATQHTTAPPRWQPPPQVRHEPGLAERHA